MPTTPLITQVYAVVGDGFDRVKEASFTEFTEYQTLGAAGKALRDSA
jgi:hypothetical protein